MRVTIIAHLWEISASLTDGIYSTASPTDIKLIHLIPCGESHSKTQPISLLVHR